MHTIDHKQLEKDCKKITTEYEKLIPQIDKLPMAEHDKQEVKDAAERAYSEQLKARLMQEVNAVMGEQPITVRDGRASAISGILMPGDHDLVVTQMVYDNEAVLAGKESEDGR